MERPTTQTELTIECKNCHGEGGFTYYHGPYERKGGECPECHGNGSLKVSFERLGELMSEVVFAVKELQKGRENINLDNVERMEQIADGIYEKTEEETRLARRRAERENAKNESEQ